ncbi:MAG: response regulator transcription factor [Actinobacteria bacterium]|nr:response regulator transcription factor [Actinomycetota bacterium]
MRYGISHVTVFRERFPSVNQSLILLVENDEKARSQHVLSLSSAGYRTMEASNGDEAISVFHAHVPDLVLLDIGLGGKGIDGLEVCRRIRRVSDTPVIFLTTRSEEVDELMGLTVGADDYLIKPISKRLLVARVAAVLRRSGVGRETAEATVLGTPDLMIDLDSRSVSVNRVVIALTRTQFDLLAALAENPSRVLTREQLVSRVWGEWYGADHHLDVHLSRLRKKIGDAGGPRVAHAVRGVGFRLSA